jgi:hypothetical protein
MAALMLALSAPPAATAAPRVMTTAGLPLDPAREQAWQQFFTALPHGPELDSLTVLLSPPAEVTRRCGREAGGCYLPLLRQMVIPGIAGPDDSFVADVARHEYGHHLAAESDNSPFDSTLGTKRWFTHEQVCRRLRSGELSDDEDARYEQDAAEGFAEAYRLTAGGDAHVWIVDPALFPGPGARRAILADARHPWSGGRRQRSAGRLTARRGERSFSVRAPLDGTVRVEVRGSAGLRPTVVLRAGGRVVARSAGRRRDASVRFVDCGRRRLRVTIGARSGSGRYSVTTSVP